MSYFLMRTWSTLPERPSARVALLTRPALIGNRLVWSAAASSGGTDLTYAWSILDAPFGSSASIVGTGDEATVLPDRAGQWRVRVEVRDTYGQTDAAELSVDVQAGLRPSTAAVTPDGRWGYVVAGSFISEYVASGILPVVWSGLVQIMGALLVQIWDAERSRSLARMQAARTNTWVKVACRTPIQATRAWMGAAYEGTDALTAVPVSYVSAVIVSASEVLLSSGSVSDRVVGGELQVLEGACAGTYLVARVNADRSGYVLNHSTLLPTVPTRASGLRLRCLRSNEIVTDLEGGDSWEERGVAVGDMLRISSGPQGVYRVEEVVSDTELRVYPAPSATRAGCSWAVLPAVSSRVASDPNTPTSTVYIPQESFQADELEAAELVGEASIVSATEIRVRPTHVHAGLVGASISLRFRGHPEIRVPISGTGTASDTYTTTTLLAGPYPRSASYALRTPPTAAGRVLVFGGAAYLIRSVRLVSDLPETGTGGTGPCWAVSVDARVPWGLEGIPWSVDPVLFTEGSRDLRADGVCAGDALLVRVRAAVYGLETFVPGVVTGVLADRLSFRLGVQGVVTGPMVAAVLRGLGVGTVSMNATEEVVFSGTAEAVVRALRSLETMYTMRQIPLAVGGRLSYGGVSADILGVDVVRAHRLPVPEDTVHVPVLRELVQDATVVSNAPSLGYTMVAKDGSSRLVSRQPATLVGGTDYRLEHRSMRVRALVYTAGSSEVTSEDAGLADHGVAAGDIVQMHTGLVRGTWEVLRTIGASTLVLADFMPADSGTARATITRAFPGSFVRIIGTPWMDGRPPDALWAPTLLTSTAQEVAASYGAMTSLRPEHLLPDLWDAPSYLHAVRALARLQVLACTPLNLSTTLAALAGQPVHEVAIRILDLDTVSGRYVGAELDERNAPTGAHRSGSFCVQEAMSPLFAIVATNPLTHAPWAVGDTLPAWTPLTRRVVVGDELTSPGWWRAAPPSAGRELVRFHGFQVLVDVAAVPSDLLSLLQEVARRGSPAWTTPYVSGIRSFADALDFADTLRAELFMDHTDHPAMSVEAGTDLDAVGGSSMPLMRFDSVGSVSVRTLFRGDDIVWDGSGFRSARGGFIGVPSNNISDQFPVPMVDPAPTTGPWVERADELPRDLVRAGDILVVEDGQNSGWFRVTDIASEQRLLVAYDADLPAPVDTAHLQTGEPGAHYQILRQDSPTLWEGLATADATSSVQIPSGNLVWDGVAVGDVLLVTAGDDYGVYVIQALNNDGTGLTLDRALTVSGDISVRIMRECLRPNPIHTGDNLSTDGTHLQTFSGGLTLAMLRRGDVIRIQSGPDAGLELEILQVVSDMLCITRTAATVVASGVDYEIIRPGRSDPPLGDGVDAERPWMGEDVQICVLAPRTLLYVSGCGALRANYILFTTDGTEAGGVDLSPLALAPGDSVDIGGQVVLLASVAGSFESGEEIAGASSGAVATISVFDGVYALHRVLGVFEDGETITGGASGATAVFYAYATGTSKGSRMLNDASTSTVAWEEAVPDTVGEWPVPVSLWRAEEWVLTGDQAQAPASITDLEGEGALHGDVLRAVDGREWYVLGVSGVTLVLAQDTGESGTPVKASLWRNL